MVNIHLVRNLIISNLIICVISLAVGILVLLKSRWMEKYVFWKL